MKTMLQIFGMFVFSVLFLSVEVKNQTIFEYIYDVISPMTQSAQNITESFFDRSVNKTQHYSKKLFDNSVPKFRDSVKSKMSGVDKIKGKPLEELTIKDKEELDELIKTHK